MISRELVVENYGIGCRLALLRQDEAEIKRNDPGLVVANAITIICLIFIKTTVRVEAWKGGRERETGVSETSSDTVNETRIF